MKKILFWVAAIVLSVSGAFAQADIQTKIDTNLMFTKNQIQRAIDDPKNSRSDDIQKLLFEPEVWKAELVRFTAKNYAIKSPTNFSLLNVSTINKLKFVGLHGTKFVDANAWFLAVKSIGTKF